MSQDVTIAQPAHGNRADPYVPMAGFIFDFNVRECVADIEDPNNKEDMSAYIGIHAPGTDQSQLYGNHHKPYKLLQGSLFTNQDNGMG